jgi:dienelactone hydrolase
MLRRRLLAFAAAGSVIGCNENTSPASHAASAQDAAAPIPPGRSRRDVALPLGNAGAPVRLRFELQRPAGAGPHPLLVLHHGSTGRGNDPSRFPAPWFAAALANSFAAAGWLVAAPQRRGRGGSEGRYEEGLSPAGTGYSNERGLALGGFARAMTDARAATDWLLARPEVDANRVLLVGQSRGGILALVQAAQAPPAGLKGVVNFVGGWLGDRFDANDVNSELFTQAGRGARTPALFLYGESDPFYTIDSSRAFFASFQRAGGRGSYEALSMPPASGRDGHAVITEPALWGAAIQRFCAELGVPPPEPT